jgi:hypothetical protein
MFVAGPSHRARALAHTGGRTGNPGIVPPWLGDPAPRWQLPVFPAPPGDLDDAPLPPVPYGGPRPFIERLPVPAV